MPMLINKSHFAGQASPAKAMERREIHQNHLTLLKSDPIYSPLPPGLVCARYFDPFGVQVRGSGLFDIYICLRTCMFSRVVVERRKQRALCPAPELGPSARHRELRTARRLARSLASLSALWIAVRTHDAPRSTARHRGPRPGVGARHRRAQIRHRFTRARRSVSPVPPAASSQDEDHRWRALDRTHANVQVSRLPLSPSATRSAPAASSNRVMLGAASPTVAG